MLIGIGEAGLREPELRRRMIAPLALATIIGVAVALLTTSVTLSGQTIPGAQAESSQALARGEWPAYGGTYAATRYSPLTQIERTNAKDLHVAWRWKSPDHAIKDGNPKIGPTRANESTPLMVGGTPFHTVAQAGEPGVETWETESWKETGNANVWAPMSADEELGYVYLPVSTPTNDFYGGHRPGDGLYGDSLVCLDAATGRKVWHYQLVHHGLWDYDTPAAPNLIDITVDGKPIKAVAQVTKQAFVYVFDRVTGKPVWPIEEQPVPASNVPGESGVEDTTVSHQTRADRHSGRA